jgi:hypothetical protein
MEKLFCGLAVAVLFGCGQGVSEVGQNQSALNDKITICHATGSDKNPFVEITISVDALPAHLDHQDGRDIIPAPEGGCSPQCVGEWCDPVPVP